MAWTKDAGREMRGHEPARFDRRSCQAGRGAELGRRLLAETSLDVAAASAALWLVSPDGRQMEGALCHGPLRDVLEMSSVPVENSVVGMVASTGLASSIGPDDYHNPIIDEKTGVKTRAMIAAPVYLDGELRGVLSVINPNQGDAFSGPDLEKLQWRSYLLGLVLSDQARRECCDD